MNRKLFISYINYYNQYKPIYDNVINNINSLIYRRLLNINNFSISVGSIKLSILTEREEQLLELDKNKIYVGIFFNSDYLISENRDSGLLGVISPDNLKLDSLLIYLSKFSIFVETEQYINLFKFFKDYWNDYIQLLLDNELETELDLLPCPVIGDEDFFKEIDSKHSFVDDSNTLRFYYTTRYKGVSENNKIGLKFYNPDKIFKSIKETCLKTTKSLYLK